MLTNNITGDEYALARKFSLNGDRFKNFSCSVQTKDVTVFWVTISKEDNRKYFRVGCV
jgi:hypothetical protein